MADDGKLTAADVKAALGNRHPDQDGEWTCWEEAWEIDFLAIRVWGGNTKDGSHRRVAYEVKVSRSDYRRELLAPDKRRRAVELAHEFYFAVPDGLLKRDEIAWVEPEGFRPEARREPTPEYLASVERGEWGTVQRRMQTVLDEATAAAPKLWVPREAGLIAVKRRGDGFVCKVVKKAPRRAAVRAMGERQWIELARRHVAPPAYRQAKASAAHWGERAGELEGTLREARNRLEECYSLLEASVVERPAVGSVWRGPWPTRDRGKKLEAVRVVVTNPPGYGSDQDVYVRWDDALERRPWNHSRERVRLGEFIAHFHRELALDA